MSNVLCPRCGIRSYTPYGHGPGPEPYPALSRVDNETYICSTCGEAEALQDYVGAKLPPVESWPLEPRARKETFGGGGPYSLDDPKHATYHSRMADAWDMREGK